MILGITGGIACGKSLAGRFLSEIGVPVIDADEVSHFLTKYDDNIIKKLMSDFGECVFSPHGQLDRKILGEIVFSSPTERARLEAILHPRIKEILRRAINFYRSQGFNLALVAPLLIEANFQSMVDVIWVISSEPKIQADRLKSEYKLSEIEAYRRINAQLPLQEKEAYADYVVRNDKSIDDFRRRVLKTWDQTLSEFNEGAVKVKEKSKNPKAQPAKSR